MLKFLAGDCLIELHGRRMVYSVEQCPCHCHSLRNLRHKHPSHHFFDCLSDVATAGIWEYRIRDTKCSYIWEDEMYFTAASQWPLFLQQPHQLNSVQLILVSIGTTPCSMHTWAYLCGYVVHSHYSGNFNISTLITAHHNLTMPCHALLYYNFICIPLTPMCL